MIENGNVKYKINDETKEEDDFIINNLIYNLMLSIGII